jgi:plasmid maintenance system antidote protein VapI
LNFLLDKFQKLKYIPAMPKNNKSTTFKEIKKALIDADVKQTDIARKLGITKQYIHVVIKGQRRTAYVRKAIARAAGKRFEELWPSRPSKKAA